MAQVQGILVLVLEKHLNLRRKMPSQGRLMLQVPVLFGDLRRLKGKPAPGIPGQARNEGGWTRTLTKKTAPGAFPEAVFEVPSGIEPL